MIINIIMKNSDNIIKNILNDVRNMKILNSSILDIIDKLSCDDKMLVIIEYNILIEKLKNVIKVYSPK